MAEDILMKGPQTPPKQRSLISSPSTPQTGSLHLDPSYQRRLRSPANPAHSPMSSPPALSGTMFLLPPTIVPAFSSPSLAKKTPPRRTPSKPTPPRPSPMKSPIREAGPTSATALVFDPVSRPPLDLYSDRYIPSRSGSNLTCGMAALSTPQSPAASSSPLNSSASHPNNNSQHHDSAAQEEANRAVYTTLLRSQLMSSPPPDTSSHTLPSSSSASSSSGSSASFFSPPPSHGARPGSGGGASGGGDSASRTFRFKSPQKPPATPPVFSNSAVGLSQMVPSVRRALRKIPHDPFKVLDAPMLKDDFYLNLLDWSSQNLIAVGLGSSVYTWSACSSQVTKVCDISEPDAITSVCWSLDGLELAVGTKDGAVNLYDAATQVKVRSLDGHQSRVGALSYNQNMLASGSRDRTILLRDRRQQADYCATLTGHRQEVCGLKWSFEGQQLASGGNDNHVLVWTPRSEKPLIKFTEHKAAVKALAWSPHQSGVLVSGGGTTDRCLKFWNTHTGTKISSLETGSQVCNVMWSRTVNEVVSTHGYSLNQVMVWKYPTLQQLATLTGHTFRVLYLAMSPDGATVVTGAGDETLRFWNIFPSNKGLHNSRGSSLFSPSFADIR